MKNLDEMTPEELDAWARHKWEEAEKRFADEPAPRISRAKREDYPHWHILPRASSTLTGLAVRISVAEDPGNDFDGRSEGVRSVDDHNLAALIVLASNGTLWAFRREDRLPWVTNEQLDAGTMPTELPRDGLPVLGWQLSRSDVPRTTDYVEPPSAMVRCIMIPASLPRPSDDQ